MSAETAKLVERIASLSGEPLSRHLRVVLLAVQQSRADAYARLNKALRASAANNTAPGDAGGGRGRTDAYAETCANVTEDLKVASEAVLALREHVVQRKDREADAVVALLDRLQALEEEKILAFVSLHALKRSIAAGVVVVGDDSNSSSASQQERYSADVVRFSKNLANVDQQIADVMDEARELMAEIDDACE
jgi:DNA repair REX1-B